MVHNATPTVAIQQGQLRGKLSTNHDGEPFYSFQGIPYAKPPIGQLRFSAPEPPELWNGVYDGTKEGPECPSTHSLMPTAVGREDNCLNLNVYTKHLLDEATVLHPVMVWIHGGGFVQGSNKTDLYGPDFLMTKDVVLVTINYRVGPLGFLCLEDISLSVPGNAGLKDQVMALRWVQKNISVFGGDPNNVTIFGESAGSASVHYLVLSSVTRGLFHRAIMQSGCALNTWAEGSRGARNLCQALDFQETDEQKMLEYLRNIPDTRFPEAMLKMSDGIRAGEKRLYGPVVEKPGPGALITDTPENIIRSGQYNKVAMIMGCTNMEGYLYELYRKIPPYAEFPIKDLWKEIDRRHGKEMPSDPRFRDHIINRVKKFYFGDESSDMNDIESTIKLKTDNFFIYDMMRAVRLHKESSSEPIYLYVMSLETKLNVCKSIYCANWFKCCSFLTVLATKLADGVLKSVVCYLRQMFSNNSKQLKGAAHADDILYLFKTCLHHPIQQNSIEDIAIRRFVQLWTNFATCGNPTPTPIADRSGNLIQQTWTPVDEDFSYLDIGSELHMAKNAFEQRIHFWDDVFTEMAAFANSTNNAVSSLSK